MTNKPLNVTNGTEGVRPPSPPVMLHDGCPQPRPDWVPSDAGAGFATWLIEGVRPAGATLPARPLVRRRELTVEDYVAGVRARDPMVLGRAITLIESRAPARRVVAEEVLKRLIPHAGGARRIGLTGIPGAGKSTFIEAFGCRLIEEGHRVAVLAVDPSSSVHGGSILGDKVRMEKLAVQPEAFIRPSPAGGTLGGVAAKTREAIIVCEAAGFDIVIVETVGVGQSEVTVRSMVDLFIVLMIAGAGDEMQGMKKGVIELADAVVINKADGENRTRCVRAQAEMRRVLHYLQTTMSGWTPPVLLASALKHDGLPEVWSAALEYFRIAQVSGELARRRRRQAVEWLHTLVEEGLRTEFFARPGMRERLARLEEAVAEGRIPALGAAGKLLGIS
jgi:LAO/AO transport system kinase